MTGETLKKVDVNKEPVSSIVDAWRLTTGDLYLIVKCSDGVDRPTIVKAGNR